MHKFYLTNNIGGGGTNVSRFVDYSQLFSMGNVGLLLNYYYLTLRCKPAFDTKVVKRITESSTISDFINWAREQFKLSRSVWEGFDQTSDNVSINGFLLDNGCGNLVRNMINSGGFTEELMSSEIEPFHDFAEKMSFDIAIAFDYAKKYTYKAGETLDEELQELWDQLTTDKCINLKLSKLTLEILKKNDYSHKVYAPIHGYDFNSFVSYFNDIISAEKQVGKQFDGFALGGIASTKDLNNDIWHVPKEAQKKSIKGGWLVSKLTQEICKRTEKPVHILGAGNIYTLPFMINAGASSSDCHSAWRRSSDSGFEKAKILIPLLDKDLNFMNDNRSLEYVKVQDAVKGGYNFDVDIDLISKLYQQQGVDKEAFYCGEILTFYSAMVQYDRIIRYCEQNPDYIAKLCKTPDAKFSADYRILADLLL